jgi:hypothetical protein
LSESNQGKIKMPRRFRRRGQSKKRPRASS